MVEDDNPFVPVIVGPTAIGKTAVTEELAKEWDILVVSADSRQVYRGLNIGTAKPDPAVRDRVPHVGLDVVEPGERFSAGQFARATRRWLHDVGSRRQAVIVGGTGFYIKAITDGLFEEPEIQEDRRFRLRAWMYDMSDPTRWARRLDPRASVVSRRRAFRAVEVALLTGYPLSWWHRKSPGEPIVRPWFVRLTMPREVLHGRISARIADMLTGGWVEEVESILASGIDSGARGLDAVGYREIVMYLEGHLTRDELPDRIATSTRRYAKRQETWFNHQLGRHPVLTVDALDSVNKQAGHIIQAWRIRND